MHHGIDLAGTWQENISVSADGTVVFAGYHGSFGKVIRIKHDYGIMTTYGHLAKINVRRGDLVSEGQVIGKMGRTGKVKGAHLHYEIFKDNVRINPVNFYYGNLTASEFEKLIKQTSVINQSLD